MLLLALSLLVPCALSQNVSSIPGLDMVTVKPNDMRMIYSSLNPGSPLLNYRGYAALSGGGYVKQCGDATHLVNTGDYANLTFRGSVIEFDCLLDATSGEMEAYVDNQMVDLFYTQGSTAPNVLQNDCIVSTVGTAGLSDGIHVASILAKNGSIFWKSLRYYTSSTAPPAFLSPQVAQGDVQVLMNNSNLVYRDGNGNPTIFSDYVSSFSEGSTGLWEPTVCGSYVDLWGQSDSVSLSFTGTAVTINVLRSNLGGTADFYLDGVLQQSINTSSPLDYIAMNCDITPIKKSGLVPGKHNVTVVNTNPTSGWFLIQNIVYTPSSGGTISPSHPAKSKAPVIGGVVGGVVSLLLLGAIILAVYRRNRKTGALRQTASIGDEPPSEFQTALGKDSRPAAQQWLDDIPPTAGIVPPETKRTTHTNRASNVASLEKSDDPPAYPATSVPPSTGAGRPLSTGEETQNPLQLVQRLLDSGVPSTEISTFIRTVMGNEPSGSMANTLPPNYDHRDQLRTP